MDELKPIDLIRLRWAMEKSCSQETCFNGYWSQFDDITQGHCKLFAACIYDYTKINIYEGTVNNRPHWWNAFKEVNGFLYIIDYSWRQYTAGTDCPANIKQVKRETLFKEPWELEKAKIFFERVNKLYYE